MYCTLQYNKIKKRLKGVRKMTFIVMYSKGGNEGSIFDNGTGKNLYYIAVTAAKSKDFKTLKGAERFMEKMGYKKGAN